MSTAIVSRTHIDALVSVARAWLVEDAPTAGRGTPDPALAAALSDPDGVGAMLWRANHDCFNYFGTPRAYLLAEAPEDLAEIEAGGEVHEAPGLAGYRFEPLAGTPHPAVAAKLVAAYLYQVSDEAWLEGLFPRESAFMDALHEALRRRIDPAAAETTPEYLATPWILADQDRDVFVRGASEQ